MTDTTEDDTDDTDRATSETTGRPLDEDDTVTEASQPVEPDDADTTKTVTGANTSADDASTTDSPTDDIEATTVKQQPDQSSGTDSDKTPDEQDETTEPGLTDNTDQTPEEPKPAEQATTDAASEETTAMPATQDKETTQAEDELADQVCTFNNAIYRYGENVPVSSECQKNCSCVDGVVQCIRDACPPSPPSFLRCTKYENETNPCCSAFDCGKCIILIKMFLFYFFEILIINYIKM